LPKRASWRLQRLWLDPLPDPPLFKGRGFFSRLLVQAPSIRNVPRLENHALERQQDVGHLLAVARLLEVGDLAAAAIGDAGLRDL
jgi:hypothetical protein